MKKTWLVSLLALLLIPAAYAGPLDVLRGAWSKILAVGSLSFLGISGTVPFTRILIWILVFALFFAVSSWLTVGKTTPTPLFKRGQAIVVAAVLATITAVFLPAAAILAVGAGWATAVALLLIGGPVVAVGALLWNLNKIFGEETDTKGIVVIKLILAMILFWILSAMGNEARIVGAAPSPYVVGSIVQFIDWALFIVSIMILWYIVKFFLVPRPTEQEIAQKDKEWQESGAAARKWLGKKIEDQKAKQQLQRREREVRPAKSYLVNAVEGCDSLVRALSRRAGTVEERRAAVKKAEKHLTFLRKNLKNALRELKILRRKEKGRIYHIFDNLCHHAGVAYSKAKNIRLPDPADAANWVAAVRDIENVLRGNGGVEPICGDIIKDLDVFIEHENVEASRTAASHQTAQQAGQRQQQQGQQQAAAQQQTQQQAQAAAQQPAAPAAQQARRQRLGVQPAGIVRPPRP